MKGFLLRDSFLLIKKTFILFIFSLLLTVLGALISIYYIYPSVEIQIRTKNYSIWILLLICSNLLTIAAYYFMKKKVINKVILVLYAFSNGLIMTSVITPIFGYKDPYIVVKVLLVLAFIFSILLIYILITKEKMYNLIVLISIVTIVVGFYLFIKISVPSLVYQGSIKEGFDYSKNIPNSIDKDIFEKKLIKILDKEKILILDNRYFLDKKSNMYILRSFDINDVPKELSEKDFENILNWKFGKEDRDKENFKKIYLYDLDKKRYLLNVKNNSDASLAVSMFTKLKDRDSFYALRSVVDKYIDMLVPIVFLLFVFFVVILIDLRGIIKKYSPDEYVSSALKLNIDLSAVCSVLLGVILALVIFMIVYFLY